MLTCVPGQFRSSLPSGQSNIRSHLNQSKIHLSLLSHGDIMAGHENGAGVGAETKDQKNAIL